MNEITHVTQVPQIDSTGEKTATVADLIAVLQLYPSDMPVWTEGCDCWGNVVRVEVWGGATVLIGRSN